jgi:hypothetical protein
MHFVVVYVYSQTSSSDICSQHPTQCYDGAIVGMSFGMLDCRYTYLKAFSFVLLRSLIFVNVARRLFPIQKGRALAHLQQNPVLFPMLVTAESLVADATAAQAQRSLQTLC